MQSKNIRNSSALFFALILMFATPLLWAQEEAQPAKPSLYERLGGLTAISVVVNDLIDQLVIDETLNANPAIDASRKRVPPPYLKYQVTSMVCQVTGGPCTYTGRGMKEAHAHLNVTEKEWNRMETIFKELMVKYEVPAQEQKELLEIVASTKADIVTK
ncbi:group 1 truncated hemoglobin [Photobacterium sp. CCB-ST2H9]|uniref:group I truncated hemoglobin n=1 Tax=Photobacterium sp. CCB-ST2H9 TaxID=2912855 RepID=UPI002006B45A|nr:group 1 truncated hemoglobin [Photobacterium sp. CCB-ST2H9]UTM59685.1 group 1 truncated hemoglobin [Photobacterium sp. CCB-ST2H9]